MDAGIAAAEDFVVEGTAGQSDLDTDFVIVNTVEPKDATVEHIGAGDVVVNLVWSSAVGTPDRTRTVGAGNVAMDFVIVDLDTEQALDAMEETRYLVVPDDTAGLVADELHVNAIAEGT